MKVIYDANVLISYLLTSELEGTIVTIIEAAFEEKYQILLPQEVIVEMQRKVSQKKYLSEKISIETLGKLIGALRVIATIPVSLKAYIPKIRRGRKDDYLLAYAAVEECDYLITGDNDLFDLKKLNIVRIVSPAQFYQILKA